MSAATKLAMQDQGTGIESCAGRSGWPRSALADAAWNTGAIEALKAVFCQGQRSGVLGRCLSISVFGDHLPVYGVFPLVPPRQRRSYASDRRCWLGHRDPARPTEADQALRAKEFWSLGRVFDRAAVMKRGHRSAKRSEGFERKDAEITRTLRLPSRLILGRLHGHL